MQSSLAAMLGGALVDHGVELRPAPRVEKVRLPWRDTMAQITRVNTSWALQEGLTKFAGIPGKRLIRGPALVDGVPPEVAVAAAAREGCRADSWWSVWGSETLGVCSRSRRRTGYPDQVRATIAALCARTQQLMRACDERSTVSGIQWRASSRKPGGSLKGGLWDVVILREEGALGFVECKEEGKDALRDNQRAFLEAVLERTDTVDSDLAIVSWARAPDVA